MVHSDRCNLAKEGSSMWNCDLRWSNLPLELHFQFLVSFGNVRFLPTKMHVCEIFVIPSFDPLISQWLFSPPDSIVHWRCLPSVWSGEMCSPSRSWSMKGGESETYLHQVSFLRCCRSQTIASRKLSSKVFGEPNPPHCIRKNWRCQKIDVDGSSQLKLHSFAQFSG